MRTLFFIWLVMASCVETRGQDQDTVSHVPVTSLKIETEPAGAIVFINGDSAGVSPLKISGLEPGRIRVRILPPDLKNWLTEPLTDSLHIEEGADLTRKYTLARKHLILTSPSGAQVLAGDSVIGSTPLVVRGDWKHLQVRKQGYAPVPLAGMNPERGIISLNLKESWGGEPEESPILSPDENGSSLKLYLSGAATILSGATAAYFKVKADNKYSDYLRSGSNTTLDEVNRLDTAAAIALVATQVSMGLFTYFVLSE